MFYLQKWRAKKGRRVAQDAEIEVEVHNKSIAQIKIMQSSETLGAYVNPCVF